MEEKQRGQSEHKITMDARERLSVTGVEDVDSFEENKIVAYTSEGVLIVKGAQLRINKLSVDEGQLEIQGIVDSINYEEGQRSEGGFFSKIFR